MGVSDRENVVAPDPTSEGRAHGISRLMDRDVVGPNGHAALSTNASATDSQPLMKRLPTTDRVRCEIVRERSATTSLEKRVAVLGGY